MGEERQFEVGQKVKVVDLGWDEFVRDDNGKYLRNGDTVTIASVDGGYVTIEEYQPRQASFYARRFEALPVAEPEKFLYRGTSIFDEELTSSDLTEFAVGTEVEVYKLVRTGTVKQAAPTVE